MSGSKKVKYLVIDTDGTITFHDETLDVPEAQRIVDGDFEILPTPTDIPVTVIVGEEAKKQGKNANWAITRLVRSRLRPDDFVAGVGIVVGLPDPTGEPTSITPEIEKAVRAKVEVR